MQRFASMHNTSTYSFSVLIPYFSLSLSFFFLFRYLSFFFYSVFSVFGHAHKHDRTLANGGTTPTDSLTRLAVPFNRALSYTTTT